MSLEALAYLVPLALLLCCASARTGLWLGSGVPAYRPYDYYRPSWGVYVAPPVYAAPVYVQPAVYVPLAPFAPALAALPAVPPQPLPVPAPVR